MQELTARQFAGEGEAEIVQLTWQAARRLLGAEIAEVES